MYFFIIFPARGLQCCAHAFSSCGKQTSHFRASLVASAGSKALGLQQLQHVDSVVKVPQL